MVSNLGHVHLCVHIDTHRYTYEHAYAHMSDAAIAVQMCIIYVYVTHM